jgi:hypothetical protein
MALPRFSFARRTIWLVGVASILAPRVSLAQTIALSEAVRTAASHDRSIHVAELERNKALREIDVAKTRRLRPPPRKECRQRR